MAAEACDAGRVSVNGRVVKASYNVKTGDIIEIVFGNRTLKAKVTDIKETTKKEDASSLVEILEQED